MVDIDLKNNQTELGGRLQKLMLLRLLFISVLLGASVFLQIRQTKTYFGDIQTTHYFLIATVYFLTFIYILLFTTLKNLVRQAYLQLLADTFFVTAIIYSTGGIGSIFSFLYILNIINASIILYRRGGMIVASSCSILYGLLLDLHYYNIIHPLGSGWEHSSQYQASNIFYIIVVNIAAFYIVAFLSSLPSEQARKSREELKEKEYDISKLEALNEWIINSITSGLITIDGQKNIILFNPAAEKIFGFAGTEVIGKKIPDILPLIDEHLSDAGEDNGVRPSISHKYSDLKYQNAKGEILSLRFFMSPLIIPDTDQKGNILLFQDVTEMTEIEKEMKRVEGLALVGELAAGIAHEIRNPMASISGSIQMLKEGMDTDEVNKRLMDIILREVDRLNHLINDFLKYARPKPFELREFNLKQMITESLELLKNSGKWKKNIELKTDLDSIDKIVSDPEQVRQVIWNILLNAVEALHEGGILFIGTKSVTSDSQGEKGPDMIEIKVRDSGKGFSERALDQMFSPFFTTKEEGSGLGLAIVKQIVEGLKGSVRGSNHPEGGAEISVLLKRL
ncbi:MAG: ATP-binding protein [Desulfobacteraceae bacterium]|jgi:two-component system sensor histidine kinase PilS (NtrC family)